MGDGLVYTFVVYKTVWLGSIGHEKATVKYAKVLCVVKNGGENTDDNL